MSNFSSDVLLFISDAIIFKFGCLLRSDGPLLLFLWVPMSPYFQVAFFNSDVLLFASDVRLFIGWQTFFWDVISLFFGCFLF